MRAQPILIPFIGKESGDRWILTGYWDGTSNITGPWWYFFTLDGREYTLKVPNGFNKLDAASVPRALRALVKMGGREMPDEAWLPHDVIYHYKGRLPSGQLQTRVGTSWENVSFVSRKFTDKMFFNELKKEKHGLASFKPKTAYFGVRAAFWKNW